MNKNEFLISLEKKLILLSDDERKDILMEYGAYIDDKISSGVTEEQAVAGFGDIDELCHDILEAYSISEKEEMTKTDETLDKIYSKVEKVIGEVGNLSMNDLFHLVFDIFIILIILLMGRVIFVEWGFRLFLSLIFMFTSHYLYMIQEPLLFLAECLYLIIAIFFFIRVISRRIQRYKNKSIELQVGIMTDIKTTWNENTNTFYEHRNNDLPPLPKQFQEEKQVKPSNIMDIVAKIFIAFLGFGVTLFFLVILFIFILMWYVACTMQAFSFGACLGLVGLLLISGSILWFLISLWPKKETIENA